MTLDYHMHTTRCKHATGTMAEYVKQGLKMGLKEIGFADHLPLSPAPKGTWSCDWAMQEEELEEYIFDVKKLQREYPKIKIKLGIEADYFPESIKETATLLDKISWDYIIGSVHHIGPWPIDSSLYLSEFAKRDLYKTYETYFELVAGAAKSGLFDIIGHLDVIKKYGFKPQKDLGSLYKDLVKELKASDVAFEINTSGLRKPVNEIYPAPALIEELLKSNVPVTLGSDSHAPSEVGKDLEIAIQLLKELGVSKIASFTGRKRLLIPLE